MTAASHAHDDGRTLLDGGVLAAEAVAGLAGLEPRGRVVVAVLFAVLVVACQHIASLLLALALAVGVAALARLPLAPCLRRLGAMDGFMALALVTLPFTVAGQPLATVGGLSLSHEGVVRALAIVLKANAVMLVVSALVGSLGPVGLGRALARLGVSDKLVHLLLFTVRYLDVLNREYRRLRTAMRARGFAPRADLHTWRSVGWLFGMLMVRSLERSERITAAMRCRGFDGRFPALEDEAVFRRRDAAFILASIAGLVVLAAVDRL